MNSFTTIPAGVRLDGWLESSSTQLPEDPPEVALLREELKKSMPEVATMLATLNELRPIQDLAARFAGPPAAEVITRRG